MQDHDRDPFLSRAIRDRPRRKHRKSKVRSLPHRRSSKHGEPPTRIPGILGIASFRGQTRKKLPTAEDGRLLHADNLKPSSPHPRQFRHAQPSQEGSLKKGGKERGGHRSAECVSELHQTAHRGRASVAGAKPSDNCWRFHTMDPTGGSVVD